MFRRSWFGPGSFSILLSEHFRLGPTGGACLLVESFGGLIF